MNIIGMMLLLSFATLRCFELLILFLVVQVCRRHELMLFLWLFPLHLLISKFLLYKSTSLPACVTSVCDLMPIPITLMSFLLTMVLFSLFCSKFSFWDTNFLLCPATDIRYTSRCKYCNIFVWICYTFR